VKRSLPGLLLGLLLVAGQAGAAYEESWVDFPARKEFMGQPVRLKALMYRPEGRGPFPAVVMLHGCGGLLGNSGQPTASNRHRAEILAQNGYVALMPDSFGPRGHWSICDQQKSGILVSRERVDDAYAARDWLATQPYVAPDRIVLMGWSHGGAGTLYAMRATRPERGFRAAIAYYPACNVLVKSKPQYAPYAPLLILVGDADDWTPAAPCVEMTKSAKDAGASMDIVTYPGAHHGFDSVNSPLRYLPRVRNSNKPDGLGATVGNDLGAGRDAMRRTLEFLAQNLKNPG
jgi:dienelactone hydrolase